MRWCTQAQCKDCISWEELKAPFFFQKSRILLFLPPLPIFLPIAGTTWASDWRGSRFHCHVHGEGAAQEEKEEIQSLGSAVLIHWFHLPGGFHLFTCLDSVPEGPCMYHRTKGNSHFSSLPCWGLQSERRRPLTPTDTGSKERWWQVPNALLYDLNEGAYL